MARQRVLFISGLGNFVPGQVSNLKDMSNYVKGVGSILSNPIGMAKDSSFGSLINPAVGASAGLLASTGALKSGMGSLGLPSNIQNFISSSANSGALFIELYLNPQRITADKPKVVTKQPTASGYAFFHWGLEPSKFKFEIMTRSLRPGQTQAQRDSATKAQQNLDQMRKFFEVNNFNIGLIYQNKVYIGHFEGSFQEIRDANNPNVIMYNFLFIVDKIPQVVLPGLGSFNVNTIPFQL